METLYIVIGAFSSIFIFLMGYSVSGVFNGKKRLDYLESYLEDTERLVNNLDRNINQDITAHVDFTALEKQGNLSELETLGFTQQGLFLMALGLGDRLNELSNNQGFSVEEVFRRREALHSLIDPMGLGNFGVLVQSKSLSEEEKKETLKGLSMPSMG